MKVVKITSLKEGDWVVEKPATFCDKKKEFCIARVKEFKLSFDEVIRMNKGVELFKESTDEAIKFDDNKGIIIKLNENDLKKAKTYLKKLKILKGLENDNITN